jgi:hypothetical protein
MWDIKTVKKNTVWFNTLPRIGKQYTFDPFDVCDSGISYDTYYVHRLDWGITYFTFTVPKHRFIEYSIQDLETWLWDKQQDNFGRLDMVYETFIASQRATLPEDIQYQLEDCHPGWIKYSRTQFALNASEGFTLPYDVFPDYGPLSLSELQGLDEYGRRL